MKTEALLYFFEYKYGVLHFKGCTIFDYGRMIHEIVLEGKTQGHYQFDFVYFDN